MNRGFLKYNRAIVFCSSLILIGYGIYFYMQGNPMGLAFIGWAALCVVSFFLAKKNPHWAFLGLAGASFIMYNLLKIYIPQITETPHFQVMISILFVFIGCGIDGLYWVYKYDRGRKIRTGYDE